MKKADFQRMAGMLVDVERLMLHMLEGKAEEAKHHLQFVMDTGTNHGDFVTACAICNNVETDRRNVEKSIQTVLRLVHKYTRQAD